MVCRKICLHVRVIFTGVRDEDDKCDNGAPRLT